MKQMIANMTQEESAKAKAYDKALYTAKALHNKKDERMQQILEMVFPELKENKDEIEKQDKQKPIDKPAPKFKVGDLVVISTSEGRKIIQVASIEYFPSGQPRYITSEGRWFGNGTKAHLWTNQDEKEGCAEGIMT